MNIIHAGHYKEMISMLPDESVQLLWTDPPFGTGSKQKLQSTKGTSFEYGDVDRDTAVHQIVDMLREIKPKLKPSATVAICLDYRAVHEAKVAIESAQILRYEREIIYHFELGAISKNWWTNKHNTILLWSLGNPLFNQACVPRIPRKAGQGKYSTADRRVNSVWTLTLGPMSKERTGYPGQKPLALITPFIEVHTNPGDLVCDPFAGSGTTGVAAKNVGRSYALSDTNPEAVALMTTRLSLR